MPRLSYLIRGDRGFVLSTLIIGLLHTGAQTSALLLALAGLLSHRQTMRSLKRARESISAFSAAWQKSDIHV